MKKNIFKKFIVLFSLVFVLFGYNFAFAVDGVAPEIGTVSDTTAPIITIKGINPVELYIGDEYVEEGVTATDDIDGDITPSVIVVNNIDINTAGNYTVTYNVSDTAGNSTTEQTRIVNVKTPVVSNPTVVVNNITVKDTCTVVDTDELEHIFPNESSTSKFLGVCALVAAKEAGYIDSFELVNDPSMGLYLKNINSTVLGSYEYWALWVNGDYATCGIGCLPILAGDTLDFILSDWSAETESTKISFRVSALETTVVVPVSESTTLHLKIISGTNLLVNKDISVTACDSDNDPITSDTITAYCAVLQSGLDSKWNWAWAPGAFVDSIGDIVGYTTKDNQNKDVYHYWSWSANGVMGFTGLNEFIPKTDDQILLEFIDPILEVITPVSSGGGSSGGSSSVIEEKTFSVENALSFLSQNQNTDGSFGSPMYTDWVAIAAKAGNDSNLKSSILNYLKSNPVSSSIITDYERRAMAIMALGINPYSGTEVNYIDKIISAFDGDQIGDSSLYNDDIFGLIVLANSGYSKNDEIIKNTVSFIVKNQSSNGSWGSVDMTAAAIESLHNFKSLNGAKDAISKGELYLKNAQKNDGGFENPSSTSWAIQALSLNSSFDEEVKKAISYLAIQQQNDLVLDNNTNINNRVWATAYAIPAALKLSWGNILESFEKEEKDILIQDINVSDSLEIEKEEILVEEKKEEPIIAISNIEKEEILTEVPIKEYKLIENKITQTNKLNNIENNINPNTSLQASVVLASENNESTSNKSFSSMVDQVVSSLKAPFVWFWNILSILL